MAGSDTELMLRTGGDDLEALGELFERHHGAIHRFVRRFLGDSAAEDVTQDVFWRVWQYRGTFDESREFSTWIYTIARHAALDELRRRDRHARPFSAMPEPMEEREQPAAAVLGSDLSVRRLLLREQVQAALLQLPPEQRTCVILREYEAKSYREIGEIMGCTEVNARVLTHRARRAMRDLLRPLLDAERRESESGCV
jgi:RNA polymerase sigma-70 factor (ECF subfamily)